MDEHKNKIEIINFSEVYKDAIKTLNYEWLEKFFKVEEGDKVSLSNPKKEIIDKGGFIFYAKLGSDIVGTAALLKKSKTIFELGKMAVSSAAQGYGIGTLLLEHAINVAKLEGANKLILYSNTKLETALRMYRKYGFEEMELEQGLYERADIKMGKTL
ncbi:GNAT family N-acetyltransferase [Sphingobacterium sp. lm-10]|uniref:GNAT family N-acetyltransferase n=1 Tax=Sphingobacterium sp. lm-10 TaxID=2944904 RepID=UPI00202128F0|nr:GNAT family N-acetyltransferase [Sphingobacterium sp. lm-10]MCL7986392.1 GNAT family N-acetyltransferase [Sphingobacterium sp. lm-10]